MSVLPASPYFTPARERPSAGLFLCVSIAMLEYHCATAKQYTSAIPQIAI